MLKKLFRLPSIIKAKSLENNTTDDSVKKKETTTQPTKRLVIYGNRKVISSGSLDIDSKQLKIGKTAKIPREGIDRIFSNPECLKSKINHNLRETPGFDAAIQRLTDAGHMLGG